MQLCSSLFLQRTIVSYSNTANVFDYNGLTVFLIGNTFLLIFCWLHEMYSNNKPEAQPDMVSVVLW